MSFAVITGASSGIGKAVAEKFLQNHFSIAICSRRSELLKSLNEELSAKYPEAKIIATTADLATREGVANFAAEVLDGFPRIGVLVNNAGVFQPGNIGDEPDNLLEELLAANLYSAYHLTRALLPAMKQQEKGHIFNMCSIASLKAYPNGGSYGITKYALKGFSDNLREELMPFNIKVSSICPGATYTPSWEGSGVDPDRIMSANDVADVIWGAYRLSGSANMDTVVLRPLKGDL